jgi:predicted RNA-binding Zn-ribbon protein involved in translation (DUF1610 family)
MREYTKCSYTNPVISVPEIEVALEQQVETVGLATTLVLFGCPDCGSLVWDQQAHDRWHARR